MQKGLLSEVRPVIAARDLDRFNELTVHAEIAARNVSSQLLSLSRTYVPLSEETLLSWSSLCLLQRMVSGGGSKDSLGASSTSSGPLDDMIPGLAENFTMKSKTAKQSGMYTVSVQCMQVCTCAVCECTVHASVYMCSV